MPPAWRNATTHEDEPPVHLKAKVLLVGVNHRVKTSLVRPAVLDTFRDSFIYTLGAKVSKKTLSLPGPRRTGRVELDMTLWDIMGTQGFQENLADAFVHGTRGLFVVCDATRPETVREADAWIAGLFRRAGSQPVVLVAALPRREAPIAVTDDDLRAVAEKYGAPYLYASNESTESTDRALRILGERITRSALGSPRGRSAVLT